MRENTSADVLESGVEKDRNDQQEPDIPKRCRFCSDMQYCDLNFCLHWWH